MQERWVVLNKVDDDETEVYPDELVIMSRKHVNLFSSEQEARNWVVANFGLVEWHVIVKVS
jgi:hypothetical protein